MLLAAAALLLAWLWLGSDTRSDGRDGARTKAGDPWDQAYGRLLDGAQSPNSGGVVVQGPTPARAFVQGLLVTPRQGQGVTSGYMITAASDAAVLAQAKLRPGDVLIDVDGRSLDPQRMRSLAEELAPADAVEVTFERDGHIRKRLIDFSS